MTDQFEQWLARLDVKLDRLTNDFHTHAEQPVHPGFADVLKDIQAALKTLSERWIQVGGAVITLLVTILLALVGVLWTLVHNSTVISSTPH